MPPIRSLALERSAYHSKLIAVILSLSEIILSLSRDEGSGCRTYVFEESTRRCAIDCKGRGCKEVIYPRVADTSCTRGVRESTGLSYGGPCSRVP